MARIAHTRRKKISAESGETRGYPRPQLERAEWINLNGEWDFAIDADARMHSPDEVKFGATIRVPFAPETTASGVHNTGFYHSVWYRRQIDAPRLRKNERLILHFGAVDWSAEVWVNGFRVASHEGGYTPFEADITSALRPHGSQTIVVRACDDPHDLAKPRGKQDWVLQPHSIWYDRTTGIWQTVWMEVVPETRIASLQWTPDIETWSIDLEAEFTGPLPSGAKLAVTLRHKGRTIVDDIYAITDRPVRRRLGLRDPGIGDFRDDLYWKPWSPNLIAAEVRLLDAGGAELDVVKSYTALRAVRIQGDRFVLNEMPLDLKLVLDQGYWPDTGLTAPDDEALRRDVELVKAMGFKRCAKASEDRRPAIPLLGGQTWVAGVGRTAERLCVQQYIMRSTRENVGRGDQTRRESPVHRGLGAD